MSRKIGPCTLYTLEDVLNGEMERDFPIPEHKCSDDGDDNPGLPCADWGPGICCVCGEDL